MFGAHPGTLYVVRPDGHVLARWHCPDIGAVRVALDRVVVPDNHRGAQL
jgi:3-(3-hydroxy-phenyl)propionate hydroxylase